MDNFSELFNKRHMPQLVLSFLFVIYFYYRNPLHGALQRICAAARTVERVLTQTLNPDAHTHTCYRCVHVYVSVQAYVCMT